MSHLFCFLTERSDKSLEMFYQFKVSIIQTDMYSCRISVVCRLVNSVVRRAELIFSSLMTHQLKSTVGNNFVGVHVGSSTCTALNHVYRELVVVFPVKNFLTCFYDSVSLFFSQQVEFTVSHSCTHLGDSQTLDEQRIFVQMKLTDVEVFDTTKGLYSI